MMNFLEEGWEETRSKHVRDALEAMSAICKNDKTSASEKIDAAKVIDAISDSILKIYMLDNTMDAAAKVTERSTKKITDQIQKLKDDEE